MLQKFLDKFVIVYLDNILIYSDCPDAHTDQVKQVLQALWENQLFTKLEKCVFSQDTVEYLGFIVSTQGISMDPAQVNTITTWPTLSSVKDVLTFLGFCNFYWRFIAWYSKMSAPLSDLTKKGEKWNWTAEHNKCFGDLKDAFVNHQVMRPFNPELQSFLETDSSGFTIARIASQISDQDTIELTKKDSHWHPFAFFSRKMNPAERNYVTGDQELLAIVASFKAWRHYFEGAKYTITVISDHNNLKYFLESKPLSQWQAHWAEFLSEFNFTIVYRAGKRNPADAPSRRPDYQPENADTCKLVPFFKLIPGSVPTEEEALLSLNEEFTNLAVEATKEAHAATTQALADADTDELLLLNNDEDKLLSHTLLDDIRRETMSDVQTEKLTLDSHFTWKDGLLYYKGTKLYVPDVLTVKLRIMKAFHDTPTTGHQGRDKTFDKIRAYFYWEGLYKFIEEYVKSCEAC